MNSNIRAQIEEAVVQQSEDFENDEGLGFLCKVSDSRHFERIEERISGKGYYTDRVLSSRVTIRLSDLAIILAPDGNLAFAAHVRPAKTGSTGNRGFKANHVVQLDISQDELEQHLKHSTRTALDTALSAPAYRPNKRDWADLWAAVKKLRPAQRSEMEFLDKLRFDETFQFDDDGIGTRLFFEKDAVGVSLDIAGIPFSDVFADLSEGLANGSGLVQSLCGNSTEDIKISHDVSSFPGYIRAQDVGHAAVFEYGKKRLYIYNVNRRRAESALGVDLIYKNEKYNSFIFVQYKMLEMSGSELNTHWTYRPDDQFNEDRKRMTEFSAHLATLEKAESTCRNYRLTQQSMYFKFCKRQHLKLNAGLLAHGYYLTLNHLNRIIKESPGKRGGSLLTSETMERWLNRTHFSSLVANGWIGTAGLTDADLKTYINDVLDRGRSIIVAEGSSWDEDDEFEMDL